MAVLDKYFLEPLTLAAAEAVQTFSVCRVLLVQAELVVVVLAAMGTALLEPQIQAVVVAVVEIAGLVPAAQVAAV
jgi:hypothetical protein